MEEDLLKYLATIMFRGTPCMYKQTKHKRIDVI